MRYLFGTMLLIAGCGQGPEHAGAGGGGGGFPIRLITLDPGHFHAALVQKSGYPEIDTVVHVYAPGGQELDAHLALIGKYNQREETPTHWKEVVYTGSDFLQKMFAERAGNVVVLAGNNQRKIGYIQAAVDSGLHVFSDKPMVIRPEDLPVLERAFRTAAEKHVILYDIMTERYQITTILQRRLSQIAALFGHLEKGTVENPAVSKESVHHFFKTVSGKPLTRPAWYFDVAQEGEGIVDVTTHLVDLIQWECFPDEVLDYKRDIEMLSARRWPTVLGLEEFRKSTQLDHFPAMLQPYLKDSMLQVYANGEMNYTLKGVHARVSVKWNFEPPAGAGDTHYSILRGTLANLVIRQGKEQLYRPVLSIEPVGAVYGYAKIVADAMAGLQADYPGLSVVATAKGWDLRIPEQFNKDHEATFAEVTKKYLGFVKTGQMPAWEVPNMMAKYYTTMKALEMARGRTDN